MPLARYGVTIWLQGPNGAGHIRVFDTDDEVYAIKLGENWANSKEPVNRIQVFDRANGYPIWLWSAPK